MAAIKIEALTKKFNGVTAVDRLSLEVESGSIVGLVGPDGGGKTTLLRLLVGLMKPTQGSIQVDGIDVVENPVKLKDRIGYIPQHFSLYGDLTVAENMRFYADLYGVKGKDFRIRKKELLAFSGLYPFEGRQARNLSGGMQKKLVLACSLFHTPSTLFLDEPTTGVDPVSRRELWRLLHELNSQGVTLLFSTPYMDEAQNCHQVALVHEGRILAYKPPHMLVEEMEDEIIEVMADYEQVRRIMKGLPQLKDIYPFGEFLHLVFESRGEGRSLTQKHLQEQGITVRSLRKIPPSFEDVFLALLRERSRDV